MIYHNDDLWKIALGRHMTPFYRSLRTPFGAPWLIGALSLIYLSFSVYFLVKLFDIRNMKLIALVSGVFATNFSLTALNATYMHDADVYMLAVLLYVLSAYLLLNFRGVERWWSGLSHCIRAISGVYFTDCIHCFTFHDEGDFK